MADKLAKDGAVIAQYGVEGAKLLAEASASLRNRPITYGINVEEGQEPVQRVSALDGFVSRLHVVGCDWFEGIDNGCAFPVSALKQI